MYDCFNNSVNVSFIVIFISTKISKTHFHLICIYLLICLRLFIQHPPTPKSVIIFKFYNFVNIKFLFILPIMYACYV